LAACEMWSLWAMVTAHSAANARVAKARFQEGVEEFIN